MKALVILKKTPDTETKIKLTGDKKALDTSDVKFVINPYDEFAIEEALKIKEAAGDCEVVICSFSDPSAKELIVKGLAMGGDRGLLIDATGLEQADSLTVAKVLSAVIKEEAPSIVLCGKQAIDDDNMHVGPMVAELLGWPHVNVVNKCEISGDTVKLEREVEGGQVEVYEAKLPILVGANKALNTPRYASLPGIMKAKKKPFDQKSPSDYGLGDLAGASKYEVLSFDYPPEKPPGKIFKDEPVEEMVAKVVQALRDEAKVL